MIHKLAKIVVIQLKFKLCYLVSY